MQAIYNIYIYIYIHIYIYIYVCIYIYIFIYICTTVSGKASHDLWLRDVNVYKVYLLNSMFVYSMFVYYHVCIDV